MIVVKSGYFVFLASFPQLGSWIPLVGVVEQGRVLLTEVPLSVTGRRKGLVMDSGQFW